MMALPFVLADTVSSSTTLQEISIFPPTFFPRNPHTGPTLRSVFERIPFARYVHEQHHHIGVAYDSDGDNLALWRGFGFCEVQVRREKCAVLGHSLHHDGAIPRNR